MADAAKQPLLS